MKSDEQLPRCHTYEDVKAHAEERAAIVGVYHQIDIRMRPKSSQKFTGHAAVRLDDGEDVLLEPTWSPAAIRSEEERKRFDGARVEAVGVVHAESPEPPEQVAFRMGPCLSPVDQIQIASKDG